MPYSEAKKRATMKYQKENLVQLAIRMKPEEKEAIMSGAEAAGLSVRNYLLSLVEMDAKGNGGPMIYGFGPTYGQTVEWNGIPWTLLDVVEVDFTGAGRETPREPQAPVTAPDGREGIMYWAPICYPEVEDFDITQNIQGVIICEDD